LVKRKEGLSVNVSKNNTGIEDIFENMGLTLEEDNLTLLQGILKKRTIRRAGYFLSIGNPSTELAFVTKGIFRGYYIDEKGNDVTKYFYPESSILLSYKAYITGENTLYSIQALEESELFVARVPEIEEAVRRNQKLLSFYKKIIDDTLVRKEEHASSFKLLISAERYELFLKQYPGLEPRVKQHQIASYLGITPVSLSRIRNKYSINK
jgi:CRP-like cAMP-binding protein